jgi:hypothetical protein
VNWFSKAAHRRWLYGITAALLAVLAVYGIVSEEQVPLWLALAGAVLGIASPAAALTHITPDPGQEPDDLTTVPEEYR